MDDPTIVARAVEEARAMSKAQIHAEMGLIFAREVANGGLSIRDRIYSRAMRREHNFRRTGRYIG